MGCNHIPAAYRRMSTAQLKTLRWCTIREWYDCNWHNVECFVRCTRRIKLDTDWVLQLNQVTKNLHTFEQRRRTARRHALPISILRNRYIDKVMEREPVGPVRNSLYTISRRRKKREREKKRSPLIDSTGFDVANCAAIQLRIALDRDWLHSNDW